MKQFFKWILDNPKKIFIIYIIACVVCGICYPLIPVCYNINDYLPPDSKSTIAIDVLEEEFPGGIPNCRVMVDDLSVTEALELKEKLAESKYVLGITWLDDQEDITIPLSSMSKANVDTYYKDGCALFSLTVSEEDWVGAYDELVKIAGKNAAVTGDAAMIAVATKNCIKEVPRIAMIGIIFSAIVLAFITRSWVEPIMVLIGLGIAVVLNAGSNIIFGQISFVTDSSGSTLQLAVSLDYSIFLIRRFEEEKKNCPNSKLAMLSAMEKSLSSIAASALTTVIGFIVLVFMKYRIGMDLGLALSKGIAISLIVVFTFMPVFILALEPLMEKTRHRCFLPSFKPFAKFAYKLRKPMMILFVIILVPVFLAQGSNSYYYGASHIYGPGTELGDQTDLTNEKFGVSDSYVLMVPRESTATEQKLSDELHKLDHVESILSYADTVGIEVPYEYLDSKTFALLESDNYSRFVINVSVPTESDATTKLVSEVRAVAEKHYPGTWRLAGNGVSTTDLKDAISGDILKIQLIGALAILLILIFTFKSSIIPVLLVLSIEVAIWLNFSIPYFKDMYVFYIAYLMVSSIQLGATVDYAILFTDRYLEYRKDMDKNKAALAILENCTPSIITSGLVLTVVGFLMYFLSSHGIISQMGYFLGFGTALSMLMVLFVLPGLLELFDGTIKKYTKNCKCCEDKQFVAAKIETKEVEEPEEEIIEVTDFSDLGLDTETESESKEEQIRKEIEKGKKPIYKQFKLTPSPEKIQEEKKEEFVVPEYAETKPGTDEAIEQEKTREAIIRKEIEFGDKPILTRIFKKGAHKEEIKELEANYEQEKEKREEERRLEQERIEREKELKQREKAKQKLERNRAKRAKRKERQERTVERVQNDAKNADTSFEIGAQNINEMLFVDFDINTSINEIFPGSEPVKRNIEKPKPKIDRSNREDMFDVGDFKSMIEKEVEQLWPKDLFKDQ